MRDFGELKKLAYADSQEFDTGNPFDFAVWMSLWHLYKMYGQGLISKESAAKIVSQCQAYYKTLALWEGIYEKYAGIEAATELARANYRKDPSDSTVLDLVRAMFPGFPNI